MSEKDRYRMAVHRIKSAHQIVNRLWQGSPNVHPDLVREFEAVQAWPWISNSYQLLEQSLKLLLAVRQGIPVSELDRRLGRSHDLNRLFAEQEDDDKEGVSRAWESFVELHHYIGVRTVRDFLGSVGGGYVKWRYMLLEGAQSVPANHIGALLEIAQAVISRLEFHVFSTRNRFPTVRERIKARLNDVIGQVCNGHLVSGEGDTEDWKRRYARLHDLLHTPQIRLAVSAHLNNTDSPILGPQPPPNPYVQRLPPLEPDLMAIIEQLRRSTDRKNFLVYFQG